MRTANRTLIIASLLVAGCSSENSSTDPTWMPDVSTPTDPGVTPVGAAAGTGSGAETVVNPGTGIGPGTGTGSGAGTGPVGTTAPTDGTLPTDPSTGTATDTTTVPPPSTGGCEPGIPATSQVPRMTPIQYDGAMRDLLGVTAVSAGRSPSVSLGIEENRGAMTSTEWTAYQNVADAIAKAVMAGPNKAQFISCDAATAGCLESTVRTFGLKAFRRPLTEDEVTLFMGFDNLTPKGTPDEVGEAILYAFLISPSFIMLPELSEELDASGAYKLTPYETATRLATLIWRSVPDDTLLEAAKNGQLNDKAQILAQAERMIGVTEKSGALLADYHRFYADIRENAGHWNRTEHDATKLPPGVTQAALGNAMMGEVSAFFSEVASTGSFKDLFLSPVAYVNKDTAAIYGLDPTAYSEELTRVELDPNQRPGFLTRVGFLSSFSNFSRTSPILRGAYIGQKMLGAPAVAPKQGVPTEPPEGTYMTRREEVDALTSPDDCKACHHVAINPPGYVMEMFDSVGSVQTQDQLGGAINTVADVMVDGTIKTINNPLELMNAIATGSSGQRMYAERWVEYATGRTPNTNDACAVDSIAMKLSSDGTYTIVKLLADLSQTEPFTLRTVGN